jgi:antitoxin YefM
MMMEVLSYSALRANLASTLDKVNEDHIPILITRQQGKTAVIMSLEDFKSYEETAYLMATPKNAERLNQAIAEIHSQPSVFKNQTARSSDPSRKRLHARLRYPKNME